MTDHAALFNFACNDLALAAASTARSLNVLAVVIREHEEEWRCTLPGQWPDEFALLNRYVRTGIKPPYIFNG